MDIRDFIKAIEPIQVTTNDASPEEDLQLMSITSIAVSLKRIADRLEAVTTIFEGEHSHGQMNVGCEGNINVSNSY